MLAPLNIWNQNVGLLYYILSEFSLYWHIFTGSQPKKQIISHVLSQDIHYFNHDILSINKLIHWLKCLYG